jgi:hypothetical protein
VPVRGGGAKATVVLVDTNVVIEAIRTKCWNAVTGGLRVETVAECRDEARRGDRHRTGYVAVTDEDLDRLAAVHRVDDLQRAMFGLGYPDAQNMDAGERDLFAHAYSRAADGDDVWILCSADKAAVRAAVALGWQDRLQSLGGVVAAVGARVSTPLADHFGERWLSDFRTACLLGR